MEQEEIVQVLSKEIKRAAEEEARKIIERAKKEAELLIESAKRRAEEIRRERMAQLIKDVRHRLLRELAQTKLEVRRQYILEREAIFEDILNALRKRLQEHVMNRSKKYVLGLRSLIIEALSNISSDDVILYVLPRDIELVKEILPEVLNEIMRNRREIKVRIERLEGNYMGGVIVVSNDGREYYNNTIDARIRMIKEEYLPRILREILVK